jgi:hypothetical protein
MIEDSDYLRFEDLVTRVRGRYVFADFIANGFRQALGYAEGYDRAMRRARP